MTVPNLVQDVLDDLQQSSNGGLWNTTNAEHPTRYNRADGTALFSGGGSERTQDPDPSRNHIVSVALVDEEPRPIGSGFDYDIEMRLSLRLLGVHADERGTVDNYGEWVDIRNETRRVLHADRTFPLVQSNAQFHTRLITQSTDLSRNLKDSFRWDCTLAYRGFETLP